MARLSEHERPGAIGMLKADCVFQASPDIIIALRQLQYLRYCYQATRTVKGRHRPGQLRLATGIKMTTNVDYIDDIYIDDIRSGWQLTLPHEKQGSKGNLFLIFNKK